MKAVPAEISSLDGLRAISIALVMCGHAIPGEHSYWFRVALVHQDLGVRIFFVISGFLITTLLLREQTKFGNISLRLFYLRRVLRILPAFLLFIGCLAILNAFNVAPVPGKLWPYVLTYTVNFSPLLVWPIWHLWSLSVEEQFYLLWPIIIKIARLRTAAIIAVLAICSSPLMHLLHRIAGITLPRYAFPLVCGPIAMGCLLALSAGPIKRIILSSRLLCSDLVLICGAALITLLDAVPNIGAVSLFIAILTDCIVTFSIARLIFWPVGPIAAILNSRPLVVAGKLSYSLYLWQQLFLNGNHPPIPGPVWRNVIFAIAVASMSYWGVEARLMTIRGRFRR